MQDIIIIEKKSYRELCQHPSFTSPTEKRRLKGKENAVELMHRLWRRYQRENKLPNVSASYAHVLCQLTSVSHMLQGPQV